MAMHKALSSLVLTFGIASTISGCDRSPPQPTASSLPSAASGPFQGIVPKADGKPAASDRADAPAIGAIEAGQARGGAIVGKQAEPTGGDGSASPPTSAAAASGP